MVKYLLILMLGVSCMGQGGFTYCDVPWLGLRRASVTQPSFVRANQTTDSGGSTVTIPGFDCSGGNYLISVICDVSASAVSVSSVTANGAPMTLIYATNYIDANSFLRVYGKSAPASGDVVVTLSGVPSVRTTVTAALFNNVGSLGASAGDFSSSTRASIQVISSPTVTSDLVLDSIAFNGSLTPTPDGAQTIAFLNLFGGSGAITLATSPGLSGSVTQSWTTVPTDIWTQIAAVLHGQ